MICALIERIEEGYRCNAQLMGYGNHTLVEAFKMEGIDIQKELNKMKIGEAKVWNIDWFPNVSEYIMPWYGTKNQSLSMER